LAQKTATSQTGHAGVIHNGAWSFDGVWLITSSSDKSAIVWQKSASDPVMVIDDQINNLGVDKVVAKDADPFPGEIRHAQFFYLDKFIFLTSSNKLFLYTFHLNSTKNDLKRYLTNSRYKLVGIFPIEGVQCIQTASAVNSFYSYIALCACSNKSVEAMDLNRGSSMLRIEDAHEAKIHTLVQNQVVLSST
jgi:WD40 repeat protein